MLIEKRRGLGFSFGGILILKNWGEVEGLIKKIVDKILMRRWKIIKGIVLLGKWRKSIKKEEMCLMVDFFFLGKMLCGIIF